jgi:predicted kinase
VGSEGSGRRVLAGQIAAQAGAPLLAVSERDLLEGCSDAEAAQAVFAVTRAARLHDAVLYWREGRDGAAGPRRAVRTAAARLVVARAVPALDPNPAGAVCRSVELPPLDRDARERLWRTSARGPVPKQVRDWLLTPGEIEQLARVEYAGDEAIKQAVRRPSESLSLLVKLPLPFSADDLVLPAGIQKAVDDFKNQVRFRWDVYETWGFERLCPNGRGVIGLFAGPSGTGKTMTAQVLARTLGLELYRLDPAQVVNKYIGETEKRLKTVFDDCDRAHFMLLIDECEGMLGQRFSSKDAHDRYANLEIDYLLQRLERFQGIAVLSTNRKADLDAAFLRRIRFVIDFLPPGPGERERLWRHALPARSPSGDVIVEGIEWKALGDRVTLTGAEITVAALNAAFLARAAGETIGMPHVIEAVRRELAKKGQTLRGFE